MTNLKKNIFQKIHSHVKDKLTGGNNDIIHFDPDYRFFLGSFSESGKSTKSGVEYPNSLGLDFSISKKVLKQNSKINVKLNCNFYYRLNPSYNEQIEHLIREYKNNRNLDREKEISFQDVLKGLYMEFLSNLKVINELDEIERNKVFEEIEDINVSYCSFLDVLERFREVKISDNNSNDIVESFSLKDLDRFDFINKRNMLARKYKKVSIKDIDELFLDLSKDPKAIINCLNVYSEAVNYDISKYCLKTDEDILSIHKKLRIKDIIDQNVYDQIASNRQEIMTPNWQIKLVSQCTMIKDTLAFRLELTNLKQQKEENFISKDRFPYSLKMFNAGISVKAVKEDFNTEDFVFDKIEINDLEESYRYNVYKYSDGLNCNTTSSFVDGVCEIKTTNFAEYHEMRRVTRNHNNVTLIFQDYISNPLENLNLILNEMQLEYSMQEKYVLDHYGKKSEYARNDLDLFKQEINRFEFGIDCLHKKSMALAAFKYMNESFMLDFRKKNPDNPIVSWRLFQLVFIVSNVPDMIVSHYGVDELKRIRSFEVTNIVDILYFSTGGGKTEAFLGCVIFSLFFDRLRGKNKGITSFVKYPLRLLSIQQLDRFLSKISFANKIKERERLPGDVFSLGYYVGSGNTLNKVDDYGKLTMEVEESPDKHLLIQKCPLCGNEISLYVEEEKEFVKHRCSNEECLYHTEVPFLFIDSELYRKPTSVIISTLDKFAIMAYHKDFSKFFFLEDTGVNDPAPTLVITDEIHLIKESLGTFSSHYESVFNIYCSELLPNLGKDGKHIKYMGATATISNYKHQSKELYMQDSRLFPALSPNIERDFYSETSKDDVSRINIAILPFGQAPVTFLLELIAKYRSAIGELICNIKQEFDNEIGEGIDEEEILRILYDYYIIIQYSNTKRDASRVRSGISSYANNLIELPNVYHLSSRTILTGDSNFNDVKTILRQIDESDNPVEDDIPDYITATSMISHGVDNNKFNAIFFLGMPNLFAEYIQAYSRVGRHSTGFVFNIMRSRVREKSFLSNFNEYLNFKELMVTPVPISRYSIGALKRTFNGVLLSLIYIYYANLHNMDVYSYNDFSTLMTIIREKPLGKLMKRIYSHDESDGKVFNSRINDLINETFVSIRSGTDYKGKRIQSVMNRLNSTNTRPMRSLRDTDTPVVIEMKGDE